VEGHALQALLYIAASLIIGLAMTFLGMQLTGK
jgi:fluoride ion exporter CrcB/FEX